MADTTSLDSWFSYTDTGWYIDPGASPEAATCQYTESIMINGRVVAINSLGANSYFWMHLIEGLKEWPEWIRALETFGEMKDVVDFQELAMEVFSGREIFDNTGHVKANARQTNEVFMILCFWDKYTEMFHELSEWDQTRVAVYYDPSLYASHGHNYDFSGFLDMYHYAMVDKLYEQLDSRFNKAWFDALPRNIVPTSEPVFKFQFKYFRDATGVRDVAGEEEEKDDPEIMEILGSLKCDEIV